MLASVPHARRFRLLAIVGWLFLLSGLCASAAPRHSTHLPQLTGIRYWSTPVYTRVAIDLQSQVRYEAVRVTSPDRILFTFYGTRLSPRLTGKFDRVTDEGFLKQIRAEQVSSDVTRIVLNVSNGSEYYAFFLPNPARLIIDVRGSRSGAKPVYTVGISPVRPTRNPRLSSSTIASVKGIGLGPEVVAANQIGEPLTHRSIDGNQGQRQIARVTPRSTKQPVVSGAFPATTIHNRPPASHAPLLPAGGEPSLARTLGLKINRIVVDAGHGGHDSGALGPDGVEEKDIALDVALRLGALLKQRLGADVVYTRNTDTFVPLETRTEIANKAGADLFISIHANSSPDSSVRGVEVYYLNFTTSADALAVAARENAVSDQSIHQLSDLVKKIALQDKISESREFASDVDESLYAGLEKDNPGLRDRGVKKAPFVVLIGANMPSILAEISFITNADDANDLRRPQYRERIAEALYRGVARYVDGLSGVRVAEASTHATR